MPEEEKKEEKKKGVLGKIKDKILPDQEEQAAIISTFVRLGVLVWSGGILTLNYVAIPGVPQQKIDPTFIASVFTGVLASFGIQTASKKGDGTMKMTFNMGIGYCLVVPDEGVYDTQDVIDSHGLKSWVIGEVTI